VGSTRAALCFPALHDLVPPDQARRARSLVFCAPATCVDDYWIRVVFYGVMHSMRSQRRYAECRNQLEDGRTPNYLTNRVKSKSKPPVRPLSLALSVSRAIQCVAQGRPTNHYTSCPVTAALTLIPISMLLLPSNVTEQPKGNLDPSPVTSGEVLYSDRRYQTRYNASETPETCPAHR
jgi:hypothetical protein